MLDSKRPSLKSKALLAPVVKEYNLQLGINNDFL
jgi:hypothetical protein